MHALMFVPKEKRGLTSVQWFVEAVYLMGQIELKEWMDGWMTSGGF